MKSILNVILKKHYATCRCLLSIMLISSIFMSTKSFADAIERYGSHQLYRGDNNEVVNLRPILLNVGVEGQGGLNGTRRLTLNQAIKKNRKELSGGIEKTQNDLKKVNSALTENKNSITNLTNNINLGEIGLARQSETDGSITIAAETHGESVSVNGTQGARFIRDVKAGINSNDAVNVSQLNNLLADNQISVAPSSRKEKSQATKKDAFALGGGAKSTEEGAIAIGAKSSATGERSVALGQQANSDGRDSLALGAGSSAPGQNAVALGRHANSSGNNSIALGSGGAAPAENAVALGANSVADRDNSVSVGSPGYERQITNVAPGTHDTDAANISQLNSVRSTATSAHGLAQKNTSRINNLENQLSKTNKKIDRGLAASAALTGLFQPYGVGNVNFTAGMGTYGSSVAMAIGSGYRLNEHAAVKAGLAYSGGNNVTSNASFNLEW